ncbi:unnamed protein product [Heligmosomoides polygyrus]|uniref:BZIP domain-containing protein n=1 Tax=Heligmosomoides polygyrus TaxID=6339 RepID=A0A183FPK2_HELPZ|nr:unnamed protein product [Heligmosomoides polygyrus]
MLSDFFRSESEDRARVCGPNCASFKCNNVSETVVFYSVQHEEELLMKYLGESGFVESVDESSTEFSTFDPFINEVPSYCYIDPSRSPDCLREDSTYSDDTMMPADSTVKLETEDRSSRPVSPPKDRVQKPSRRGRPMKITSTSKMASYARNYREQKKSQLLAFEAQVKELTEENKYLRDENKRLSEGYARLSQQVESLRKMIESSSYSSRDPLQTPVYSGSLFEKSLNNDLFDINELITFPQ